MSHTLKRPAGRKKRKEGILFSRTCALWNQKQKIKGNPNLYEKKKVRIKLIVS